MQERDTIGRHEQIRYRQYWICRYPYGLDGKLGYWIEREGATIQRFVATVEEAKSIIDSLVS